MKKIVLEWTFYHYWHIGSGTGDDVSVDLSVLKDDYGLPVIPGKTIKGLFRDAYELMARHPDFSGIDTDEMFGHGGRDTDGKEKSATLRFYSAGLPEDIRKYLLTDFSQNKDIIQNMYRTTSTTSLDEGGIAKDHTLRKKEVTIQMKLISHIDAEENINMEHLKIAAGLVKFAGSGRNRGLGRLDITVKAEEK